MANYIGGGLRPQNGPWTCAGCDAYFFLATADGAKLQARLDSELNAYAGYSRFAVLVDAVAITFQSLRDLQSKAPDNVQPLSLNYNEAAFWFLIKDLKDNSIKVWVPYMFCSDPVALYTGRQIYGFPKEFAKISVPDASGKFSVTAHTASTLTGIGNPALKEVFSAVAQSPLHEANAHGIPELSVDKLATIRFQRMQETASGNWLNWGGFDSPWSQYVSLLISPSINFVFSRNEFDIAAQRWKTSITMADSAVTQSSFQSILQPHQISLTLDDSHNMTKEFGLDGIENETEFKLTSLLGASIKLKFELSVPRNA